jgi:hypothetical protein
VTAATAEQPTGFAGMRALVSRFMPRVPDPLPIRTAPTRWEAARIWITSAAMANSDPLRLGSLFFFVLVLFRVVRHLRGRGGRRTLTGGEVGGGGHGLGLGNVFTLAARKIVETARMGTRVTYL